jgi:hypothetical protein
MITESEPIRSRRQAAPEIANQLINLSRGALLAYNANGAAIQKLRQLKQSMRLPSEPEPSLLRI